MRKPQRHVLVMAVIAAALVFGTTFQFDTSVYIAHVTLYGDVSSSSTTTVVANQSVVQSTEDEEAARTLNENSSAMSTTTTTAKDTTAPVAEAAVADNTPPNTNPEDTTEQVTNGTVAPTTSAPTTSPVTSAPTSTEHAMRDWPYWKSSQVIKRKAHRAVAAASAAVSALGKDDHAAAAAAHNTSDWWWWPRPDAALERLRVSVPLLNATNNATSSRSDKPIMAIITSTLSKGRNHLPLEESALAKHLLPSILRTITEAERALWRVHVYVAIDDTDDWWLERWEQLQQVVSDSADDSWLNVTLAVFPTRKGNIPFNEIALVAYDEGAEYFCRVNDDTEFITVGWITMAVAVLQYQYDPPNVGVVAPKCGQGNTAIMTHDLVHRTHMDIFHGNYYPPAFDNWYLDDWMTQVYSAMVMGPEFGTRSTIIGQWEVKHWVFESRYAAQYVQSQWLPYEYERGHRFIANYLAQKYPAQAKNFAPSLSRPKHMDPAFVSAVLDALPPDGNLLVWGFNDDAPFWHRATSGFVVVVGTDGMKNEFFAAMPYIYFERVEYNTGWGTMEQAYQKFVVGQDMERNNWCELQLPMPETIAETAWDVILVVAPDVGVSQPMFATQTIAMTQLGKDSSNKDASIHVFVNEYERDIEREFSQKLFNAKPDNVIRSQDANNTKEFGHFILGGNHSMSTTILDDCPVAMDFRPSPNLVHWAFPNAVDVAMSSLVMQPESWVILLEVNSGYYDFLVNWWFHFSKLNITIPVEIVVEDDSVQAKVEQEILTKYSNVVMTRSAVTVNTTAADWGTPGFALIVSNRPLHIRQRLEQGINVISTDVDTVWRSSPLPYLAATSKGVDIVASVNGIDVMGHSPYYSVGFMALVSNNQTVALMSNWEERIKDAATINQHFNAALYQTTLKHQPLHWNEFPNGQVYFEQYRGDAQRDRVVVVHNDFVMGFDVKKARFEKHGLWNVSPT
jgi:Nucleotide-diphospho-sugar transferase/Polysaccharide biosynthesis